MKAIEGAVLELITIGYDRGFWKYEKLKINKPDCVDDDCIATSYASADNEIYLDQSGTTLNLRH